MLGCPLVSSQPSSLPRRDGVPHQPAGRANCRRHQVRISSATGQHICTRLTHVVLCQSITEQNRKEFTPSHQGHSKDEMEFTLPVIPGCSCPSHREIFDAWPKSNAILRVSSCMRICPYCGKTHSNASRLRKHLKGYTYRSKNLTVEAEHAGVEVRFVTCYISTVTALII